MTRHRAPGRTRIAAALSVAALLAAVAVGCGDDDAAPPTVPTDPPPTVDDGPDATDDPAGPDATDASDDPDAPAGTDEPAGPPDPTVTSELAWSVRLQGPDHPQWIPLSLLPLADGRSVAAGGFLALFVLDLADGSVVRVDPHQHRADDLARSPDGTVLGVAVNVYADRLVDPATAATLVTLRRGYDSRIEFAPDGSHVVTSERDAVVRLWSIDDGTELATLEPPGPRPETGVDVDAFTTGLEYHPDGRWLAVTRLDCTVHVWDVDEGRIERTLGPADGRVARIRDDDPALCAPNPLLAITPDGAEIVGVVAVDDPDDPTATIEALRIWAVDGAARLDAIVPPRVTDLAVSPDGELVVVASQGATTVWSRASGALLHTLDQSFAGDVIDWPVRIAFTLDGGHLVVGRNDGTVEAWRLDR